jgi:hypothetical protein
MLGRRWLPLLLVGACLGCGGGVVPEYKPEAKAPAPAQPPAPPPEMVQEKAQVGVGEKGRDLGTGFVSTPVKAYFLTKERLVFEIQVPQAMQLWEATNGRKPKSHDEFMKEIIEFNRIPLPQLPADSHYVYNPETAELMVEHPKRN